MLASSELTGVLLVALFSWAAGLALVHALIDSRALTFACDAVLSAALASFYLMGMRAIRRRLPSIVVMSDGIEETPSRSIGKISYSSIVGTRWTTERYGVGPWNEETILWLLTLDRHEIPIGRGWENYRQLQRDIVSRLSADAGASVRPGG